VVTWRPLMVLVAAAAGARAPAAAQDSAATAARDVPPAGYGTLRQDDIALRLETVDLQIRALPLDERVIRLLSPDTYATLHGLTVLKRQAIAELVDAFGLTDPALFVVTFFGLRERARYIPEDFTITSRGRFFRPIGIIPLSPRWSEQQLGQRETALAVYVFEAGIEVLEPFIATYGGVDASGWERNLRTLDEERAAVLSRAAARRN